LNDCLGFKVRTYKEGLHHPRREWPGKFNWLAGDVRATLLALAEYAPIYPASHDALAGSLRGRPLPPPFCKASLYLGQRDTVLKRQQSAGSISSVAEERIGREAKPPVQSNPVRGIQIREKLDGAIAKGDGVPRYPHPKVK
jgi:hypothetical protein